MSPIVRTLQTNLEDGFDLAKDSVRTTERSLRFCPTCKLDLQRNSDIENAKAIAEFAIHGKIS